MAASTAVTARFRPMKRRVESTDPCRAGMDRYLRLSTDQSADAMDASKPPPPRPERRSLRVRLGDPEHGRSGRSDGLHRRALQYVCDERGAQSGHWMAWVSSSASARVVTAHGGWAVVPGHRHAGHFDVGCGHSGASRRSKHPIDRDELGTMRINSPVWTGGTHDGGLQRVDVERGGERGVTGSTGYATPPWQEVSTAGCMTAHRVYCFEE